MLRKDWLIWRKQGIGSSDSPVIMGTSPWKTIYELYEEKISPLDPEEDTSNQYVKDLGNEAESKVRSLFELTEMNSFEPALVEMAEYPFLRASLDGRSKDKKTIIEIKLSGIDDWTESKEKEIVPEKYWPQVQKALMVSGADICYYVSYLLSAYKENPKSLNLSKLAVIKVKPDREYQALLLEKELAFWDCVKTKTPPDLTDQDLVEDESPEALTLAEQYIKNSKQIKLIEKENEAIKNQLVRSRSHPRTRVGPLLITRTVKSGVIDYSKVDAIKGVDLEPFRKPPSVYYTLKETKQK